MDYSNVRHSYVAVIQLGRVWTQNPTSTLVRGLKLLAEFLKPSKLN